MVAIIKDHSETTGVGEELLMIVEIATLGKPRPATLGDLSGRGAVLVCYYLCQAGSVDGTYVHVRTQCLGTQVVEDMSMGSINGHTRTQC
jgi:hypothetical protein